MSYFLFQFCGFVFLSFEKVSSLLCGEKVMPFYLNICVIVGWVLVWIHQMCCQFRYGTNSGLRFSVVNIVRFSAVIGWFCFDVTKCWLFRSCFWENSLLESLPRKVTFLLILGMNSNRFLSSLSWFWFFGYIISLSWNFLNNLSLSCIESLVFVGEIRIDQVSVYILLIGLRSSGN